MLINTDNKRRWWTIFYSVCAALFGVQSEANRQRDFSYNSMGSVLIVGGLTIVGLVLCLIFIVTLVVPS